MNYEQIEVTVRRDAAALNAKKIDASKLYVSRDVFTEIRKFAKSSIWYDSHWKWTYLGLKVYLVSVPSDDLVEYIEVA